MADDSRYYGTGHRKNAVARVWLTPGSGRISVNGKDLEGWHVKITGYDLDDNFGDTFRVEDGALKVAYDAYDQFSGKFGHIFYEKPFSHYRLRVEYRFVDEQVAGITAVGRRGAEQAVDAATAVDLGIGQDLDEVIRC